MWAVEGRVSTSRAFPCSSPGRAWGRLWRQKGKKQKQSEKSVDVCICGRLNVCSTCCPPSFDRSYLLLRLLLLLLHSPMSFQGVSRRQHTSGAMHAMLCYAAIVSIPMYYTYVCIYRSRLKLSSPFDVSSPLSCCRKCCSFFRRGHAHTPKKKPKERWEGDSVGAAHRFCRLRLSGPVCLFFGFFFFGGGERRRQCCLPKKRLTIMR